MRRPLSSLALLALLALLPISAPSASAQIEDLSAPGSIPLLRDFTTPILEPGQGGTLNFTLRNRYLFPMFNVSLLLEVYRWGDIDAAKDLEDVNSPPTFTDGEGSANPIVNPMGETPRILFFWAALERETERAEPYAVRVTVSTYEDTTEGVYFIRTAMEFDYDSPLGGSGHYVMRSRGFFSDDQWDRFEDDSNLSVLGVDGVLPDTSLSVRGPVSKWPWVLCGGLILLTGGLAALFYATDEMGKFPALKEHFDHVEAILRGKKWP